MQTANSGQAPAQASTAEWACRVIPSIELDDAEAAAELARALADAGVDAIELVLQTMNSVRAIEAARGAAPGLIVAAGRITSVNQLREAASAGAQLAFSMGADDILLQTCLMSPIPLVPGVQTASEVLGAWRYGYGLLRFFPAASSGGLAWLDALAVAYPSVRFVADGGIEADNARDYLARSNVAAVAGTQMLPRAAIEARDWAEVARVARELAALG